MMKRTELHMIIRFFPTGLKSQNDLVESFYEVCRDAVAIGDCITPSSIMNANFEGYVNALNI